MHNIPSTNHTNSHKLSSYLLIAILRNTIFSNQIDLLFEFYRHVFNLCHLQSITTIRMGELEPWMDETFIRQVWYNLGEQVLVKLIRDKVTGYVFLSFIHRLGRQGQAGRVCEK